MYELRYIGSSRYGVSIHLADRRSVVTVSKRSPFKLGAILTDQEIRYYRSLIKCDVVLVSPVLPQDEIVPEPIVEQEVQEEEVVVEESPEEVVDIESIYNRFIDELTDDDVDNLCDEVEFSSRKRNKGKKFWDLLNSDKSIEAIQILLNR